MSWYRTYRPTTVSGLHLASVRGALLRMLETGVVPHALLFAGPKGTGKTSAARIISAVLNDPANAAQVEAIFFGGVRSHQSLHEPDPSQDIIQRIQKGASFAVQELDAASNRGIDDIRQLKERIFLPPQEGKVAVYILDEVHMLTTEAFNALLKILEEPPPHVVFILATTELHKVPETIVSRCTVVQFQKADTTELTQALENILKSEHIKFDPAALTVIVEQADGSFRDAVKLLETLASGKTELTTQDVEAQLPSSLRQSVKEFIQLLLSKDEQRVTAFFQDLRQRSNDQAAFHKLVVEYLHQKLVESYQPGAAGRESSTHLSPKVAHFLLTQLSTLPIVTTPTIPFLSLELKALELIFKSKEQGNKSNPEGSGGATSTSSGKKTPKGVKVEETATATIPLTPESFPALDNLAHLTEVTEINHPTTTPQFVNITHEPDSTLETVDGNQLITHWEEFLQQMKHKNSSIEALLRSSKPLSGERGRAKIEVYYQFHREQLQQPKFLKMMEECVSSVLGGKVLFEFTLAAQARAGVTTSTVSGNVNQDDQLIELAKEILV